MKKPEAPQNSVQANAAKAMIDERTARARKIIMPHYITPEEKKEEKKAKKDAKKEAKRQERVKEKDVRKESKAKSVKVIAVKLIDKEEEKRILSLDCKKHFKMYLLYKGGYDKKEIAELITHGNVGYVSNEIKKYAEDPERVKKYAV